MSEDRQNERLQAAEARELLEDARDTLAHLQGQSVALRGEGLDVDESVAWLTEFIALHEERDALSVRLAQAERMAECDCVPCIVSSKSCHKCGRKATIPQEQMVRGINDLEARLAQAEQERDEWKREADRSKWPKERAQEFFRLRAERPDLEVRLREYEEALREIMEQDSIELALDPQWSQRIAKAALDERRSP